MTLVVISDRRTSSVTLAAGDSLFLTSNASIIVSTVSIFAAGGNSLSIDGDVLNTGGIGVPLGRGLNNVSVSETGSVISSSTAIHSTGPTTLTNAGQIFSSTAEGVVLNAAGNLVSNSGVMFGNTIGLEFLSDSNDFTNTGLVQGGSDDGIKVTASNNIIRNFGTIDGRVDGIELDGGTSGAANTIINWASIIGRGGEGILIFGDSSDVVVNRGLTRATGGVAVFTGTGNDVFDNSFGGVVSGVILMEPGDDLVIAGQSSETINGGSGVDTISYINHPRAILINLTGQVTADGVATDTLVSLENAVGSAFNDTIHGNDDANVLDGGPGGSDQIFGHGGSDTVSYASAVRAVLINLQGQVAADGVDTDSLSSIENAIGSRFNDTIHGDGGDNVLDGGVEGSDQIFGGPGVDTVSYATSPRAVLINLAGQVTSDGINTDTLSSIEDAIGSGFSDTFVSSDGTNRIDGSAGTDTVSYAASAHAVMINLGGVIAVDEIGTTDVLIAIENATGSRFNDTIFGDLFANVLDGGAGADSLTGGDNNDMFVFRRGQANGDSVADFSGNGDFIGDLLQFVGYGPGATFVQLDGTQWQINSGDGLTHDTITLQNGAPVYPTDVLFL
jgi:hypothetical protein